MPEREPQILGISSLHDLPKSKKNVHGARFEVLWLTFFLLLNGTLINK